jgi:hypothetical protein
MQQGCAARHHDMPFPGLIGHLLTLLGLSGEFSAPKLASPHPKRLADGESVDALQRAGPCLLCVTLPLPGSEAPPRCFRRSIIRLLENGV